MGWKCEYCGQKLTGVEKYCPNCSSVITYKCKSCGKVMNNGKHKKCAFCNTKNREKYINVAKTTGRVAAAGVVMIAVNIPKFLRKR